MPPEGGTPRDRSASRLTRRQLALGAGAAGLGLLAGCGRLPFQQPPPTAVKVHRLGYLNGTNPAAQVQVNEVMLQVTEVIP